MVDKRDRQGVRTPTDLERKYDFASLFRKEKLTKILTGRECSSIFDALYPVGSIYLAYNHIDPGTLFGGTWERLENAFLLAVDSSGTIGETGGEETHTLTIDEIPRHSHGPVYSHYVDADKTTAWLSSGGTNMAYGPLYAGGGQAHNNMPPYIKISAWRRIA